MILIAGLGTVVFILFIILLYCALAEDFND